MAGVPVSGIDTAPMFDMEPTKPKRTRTPAAPSPGVKWSKYRPVNPVKCDHCLRHLAEHNGVGYATNPAKWKRVQNGADELLCYDHAAKQRQVDGLAPLRVP